MKSLAEQVADLEDPAPPPEADPESHDVFAGTAEIDSDASHGDQEFDGREHYEEVGSSKLRKPSQPSLGKRYEGASVSRNALNGEADEEAAAFVEGGDEDSDPFAEVTDGEDDSEAGEGVSSELGSLAQDGKMGEDSEIDSDEAFGSGDEEKFKGYTFGGSSAANAEDRDLKTNGLKGTRGKDYDLEAEELEIEMEALDTIDSDEASGLLSGSDSDLDMDDADFDEENDEDGDETDMTSDELEDRPAEQAVSIDRAALRALVTSDTKAVASTISAAAAADVQKGRAVKEQYRTFDKLIDLRIKLQKGLTVANELPSGGLTKPESSDAVPNAEVAALQLWSTLESLRHDFLNAQDAITTSSTKTKKRKRPFPPTQDNTPATLWSRSQSLESQSLPFRRIVLNKWSSKVRASTASAEPRPRLNALPTSTGITNVIDSYLTANSSRITAKSSSSANTGTPLAYDDSLFYQSLLRDLITSRSHLNNTTNQSEISATLLPSTIKLHPSGSKSKKVDTKASKGRKVRYTVHEKLMNFAAPETATTTRWTEEAKGEFFGSLFGGRVVLDEGAEEIDEQEEDIVGGEGLILFR